LEVAVLEAAQDAGVDASTLRKVYSLRDEFTFGSERRLMSVVYDWNVSQPDSQHRTGWAAVKGAPEAVLARSASRWLEGQLQPLNGRQRQAILDEAARMAGQGLRVIACAEKEVVEDHLAQDEVESGLTFVGLVGFHDPPRAEARQSIAACRTAGIRPIMITGDHPLTARAIANQVGMDGHGRIVTGADLDALSDEQLEETVSQDSLYARATPEHKLRIVHALHRLGERVAVTGDGINDAPALVAADIGVAMGETGTDVAREAADIVLADDNFATIVRAVDEGRVLFANLTKGVRYYLTCKVALVSATLLATLMGVPVPFAPVQIILMELFMDLAAAATFVAEPSEGDLMRRPPRDPQAKFMDRAMVTSVLASAVGLFAAVSISYLGALNTGASLTTARTMAFVTWLLGHVFLALNMRSERLPLFKLGVFSNRLMIIWGAAAVAFVLLATLVPAVQTPLRTAPLSGQQWMLVMVASLAGTFWLEVRKVLSRRFQVRGTTG
jgi:Ca2+-transporting ATPase